MRRTVVAACAAVLLCIGTAAAQAQDDVNAQITQIRQQLSDLQKQLNDLQKLQEENSPTVYTAYRGARTRIDGRIFAGTVGTQSAGSDPNWSSDIPDAKLRFTFFPTKNVTIVNRFSTSGGKTANFDYFYADTQLGGNATALRLGQRKIDFGQETWVDNPIENILIDNSISHVSGYGIGTALLGKMGAGKLAPLYEAGFVNGPKGVTVRPSTGLPVNFKIGKPLSSRLFVSASYFQTGQLHGADQSALGIAEISDAPAGTTQWNRKIAEFDLRYNYGTNGIRTLPAALPRAMFGVTWGAFDDNLEGVPNRDGRYWFAEALYSITSRIYAAGRYSTVDLGEGQLAKLGRCPIGVNAYRRTSFGLGYRLTDLADLKVEYTINDTLGGATQPGLNQWAAGVAAKF